MKLQLVVQGEESISWTVHVYAWSVFWGVRELLVKSKPQNREKERERGYFYHPPSAFPRLFLKREHGH
jgi:hypothetical protein